MINQQQKDDELWRMARARVGFRWSFACYFVVNAFLVAVWFFTSDSYDDAYFWPIWPIMGWGIGIAFQYFHAFHGNKFTNTQKEYERLKRENERL
jgi:hypothetical protein